MSIIILCNIIIFLVIKYYINYMVNLCFMAYARTEILISCDVFKLIYFIFSFITIGYLTIINCV